MRRNVTDSDKNWDILTFFYYNGFSVWQMGYWYTKPKPKTGFCRVTVKMQLRAAIWGLSVHQTCHSAGEIMAAFREDGAPKGRPRSSSAFCPINTTNMLGNKCSLLLVTQMISFPWTHEEKGGL